MLSLRRKVSTLCFGIGKILLKIGTYRFISAIISVLVRATDMVFGRSRASFANVSQESMTKEYLPA